MKGRMITIILMNHKIAEHIDIAEKDSDITHELLIIKDKVEWWRLYKKSQDKLWNVSHHTTEGWENGTYLPSNCIKEKVHEMQNMIYGFQHRTVLGTMIFKLERTRG